MVPSTDLMARVLASQWRVLVGYVVVGVLVVGVSSVNAVRWYEAHAVLQLLAEAGQEVEGDAVRQLDGGGFMEGRDRARTQLQIIQSQANLEEVIRRYRRLGHWELTADARGTQALAEVVSAGPREDTQLIEVRVQHTNPDKAALLADLVAQVYLDHNMAFRRNAAEQSRDWLTARQKEARADLQTASDALLDYDAAHTIVVDTEDDSATRLMALQAALGEAETRRVKLGSALAEHERLLSKGRTDVLAGMFDDVGMAAIARRLARAQADAAEQRARYGERHPEYRRAQTQLDEVKRLVATEVGRLVRAERSNFKALQRQEAQVREEMASVKAGLMDVQRRDKKREALAQADSDARALVASLNQRARMVELQAETQLSDARLVEHAAVPRTPVRPDLKLQLILAWLVSVIGGAAFAAARYFRVDAVRTPDDVEARTGVHVIGALPTLDAGNTAVARALYPARNPRSLAAEAHRSLRTMMQARLPKDGPLRLLVSSGVAGEGKTTTIAGMAASFARLGQRVLVVDADLRRPRLHTLFQRGQVPGLAELLRDGGNPLDHVTNTTIDNVALLPAGDGMADGAELLASLELPVLFDHLSKAYDVVLVDSSPVGLVSDCLALARVVDGAVLVVRRDKAPVRLAHMALQRLAGTGVRILGTVLNDVPPSKDALTYGQGYYREGRSRRGA